MIFSYFRRGSTGEIEMRLPVNMTLGKGTMKGPDVDAGVYIRVDSLGPGKCFVSFWLNLVALYNYPKIQMV